MCGLSLTGGVDGRFGIGRFTTEEEIDYTADKCIQQVRRLREMRLVQLPPDARGLFQKHEVLTETPVGTACGEGRFAFFDVRTLSFVYIRVNFESTQQV